MVGWLRNYSMVAKGAGGCCGVPFDVVWWQCHESNTLVLAHSVAIYLGILRFGCDVTKLNNPVAV